MILDYKDQLEFNPLEGCIILYLKFFINLTFIHYTYVFVNNQLYDSFSWKS